MKVCINCSIHFEPTGQNQKRCSTCAREHNLNYMRQWYKKNVYTGKGSGSKTKTGSGNHMFKHGQCSFRRWAKEKLIFLSYCCERCGTVIDASKKGSWAGHHKDHNRLNNIKDNLEVLCKRCHQIEHECWTAFQGVTTIPQGSTLEIMEAHSPEASGDDIV